jgi:hypothetical protein
MLTELFLFLALIISQTDISDKCNQINFFLIIFDIFKK